MSEQQSSKQPAVSRLIRRRDLLERLGGISASTLWRWEAAGTFPKHFTLGGTDYWDAESVQAHIARQRDEARGQPQKDSDEVAA